LVFGFGKAGSTPEGLGIHTAQIMLKLEKAPD